jgi:hypothetical protein
VRLRSSRDGKNNATACSDDRQRENETQPVDVSHDFVFHRSSEETEEMTTLYERTSAPFRAPFS